MKHMRNRLQAAAPPAAEQRSDKTLRDAVRLAESGRYEQALAVLNRSSFNTEAIRNARGVCLMRLGRIEDALRVFRSLVLAPGSTWMKRDLPVVFCTNFCTVLLLAGHPAGCFDALSEIADRNHPSVVRLRQTLDRWQRTLPFWSWLIWKLGSDPSVPITLDFAPGEFTDQMDVPTSTPPNEGPSREAA